mmetsp:Transcript_9320/g.30876  ORF Transcript_9320/g.30876 Transcript_9320/m.30876 type:complete len:83 (-) Transcript_9320:113-361(-)
MRCLAPPAGPIAEQNVSHASRPSEKRGLRVLSLSFLLFSRTNFSLRRQPDAYMALEKYLLSLSHSDSDMFSRAQRSAEKPAE